MPLVRNVCVAESRVGDGVDLAHVDVVIGPRGSAAEEAFVHALTQPREGFSGVLATLAPNLMVKPACVIFNKVSLKLGTQGVNLLVPAQRGVSRAVVDAVAEGIVPCDEAAELFLCVGVFIHWQASDEGQIEENNFRATFEALARAVSGLPTVGEVLDKKDWMDGRKPI